jgi:argininosuccinate lyase
MTLWGGAFSEPTDDDLRALNDSFRYDRRMAQQDINGSMAYALAMAGAGVLTRDEAETLVGGLTQVAEEFDSGTFAVKPDDEDVHTAVERRLGEIVGDVAGKLHTGRSRNDQVATDFRLWVMDAIDSLTGKLRAVQAALVEQAEQHTETLMAGWTHVQPAQPITVAHWLLSMFWPLERDIDRLRDARRRCAVSPLGSGALAGTPYALDREELAKALGFSGISQNSLDAVSDRDFTVEFLSCVALVGVHLSRLGEDLVLFSNPAFGYVTLADRYSTGSSLMPQKRNADSMELTRGTAGRLIGYWVGLMTTLKGLPTGYNKDLQEDKEAVFAGFDSLSLVLPVAAAVVRTLTIHPDKLRAALVPEMLATDLAEYLVKRGLPFRQAHHVAGRAVRLARERSIPFDQIPLADLQALSPLIAEDVAQVFDYAASAASRAADGGTAPDAVRRQLEQARHALTQ